MRTSETTGSVIDIVGFPRSSLTALTIERCASIMRAWRAPMGASARAIASPISARTSHDRLVLQLPPMPPAHRMLKNHEWDKFEEYVTSRSW